METKTNLLEAASAEQDEKIREEANSAYESLSSNFDVLPDTDLEGVFPLKIPADFAKKYPKLIVSLILEGSKNIQTTGAEGQFSIDMGHYLIDILGVKEPSKEYFKDDMHAEFARKRRVFIHEFIHYLDNLRHKRKQLGPDINKHRDHNDEGAYFSNPVEYNAYYHNISDFIEGTLKRNNLNEKQKKLQDDLIQMLRDNDFKGFLKFLNDNIQLAKIYFKNPKLERNIKKRLYEQFKSWRDKYINKKCASRIARKYSTILLDGKK